VSVENLKALWDWHVQWEEETSTLMITGSKVITSDTNKYPLTYYFRGPELATVRGTVPYETYKKSYQLGSGIIGKVMTEELPHGDLVRPYFDRYKEENPNKLALLHYNGNAREAMDAVNSGNYFAGSWLYATGGHTSGAIPKTKENTTIEISNTQQFMVNNDNPIKSSDVAIVPVKENGELNWFDTEYGKMVSKTSDTITIERGKYSSEAKEFKAGTYIAP